MLGPLESEHAEENRVTMEIPLLDKHHYDNLCSILSGFFLVMTAVTITFDILATMFLVYKPPKDSDEEKQDAENPVGDGKTEDDVVVVRVTGEDLQPEVGEIGNPLLTSHHCNEENTDSCDGDGIPVTIEESVCSHKVEEAVNAKPVQKVETQVKDEYGFTLLKKLDFHLIIWPGVFLGGIQVAYMYNLTAMMKSFGLEEHSTVLLTINFLSCALTRIPVFIFIDKVANKSLFLLTGAVSVSLAFILTVSFGHNVVLFTVGIILSAFTNSCSWTSTAALLSELFGTKYFGYNYGWMTCGYGLFAMVLQTLAGYLYDLNIDTSVTHSCYGDNCFVVILIVCLVLSIVSAICSTIHLWKGKYVNNVRS